MIEYRNPKQWPDGRIDCEINHPALGWIPFTAVEGDESAALDVTELRAAMLADTALVPVMTPEELAAREMAARALVLKAECRARILAVSSETTQMNIAQAGIVFTAAMINGAPRAEALGASGLQEGDLDLAQGWKAWVAAMQAECRRAIETGDDPVWPEVPEGVAGLTARF
ncbi:hypothetical protein ACLGGT_13670 [Roseovarius sp. MS2]|uniref:hypothetical protein n=1 Tax=Roseovarius sp. MS2 TaxID=3390728 RepID=UPI003EDBD868